MLELSEDGVKAAMCDGARSCTGPSEASFCVLGGLGVTTYILCAMEGLMLEHKRRLRRKVPVRCETSAFV